MSSDSKYNKKLVKFFYDCLRRESGICKKLYAEKYFKRARQYAKEWAKKNPQKFKKNKQNWDKTNRQYISEYNKQAVLKLPDSHILKDLRRVIAPELITPELIELTRVARQLKREIKTVKNNGK